MNPRFLSFVTLLSLVLLVLGVGVESGREFVEPKLGRISDAGAYIIIITSVRLKGLRGQSMESDERHRTSKEQ